MTATYPKPPETVRDFFKRFPDHDACAEYLFQLRWPDGYVCPKCGSTRAGKLRSPKAGMECENHHKISVTAGTALHRTKIGLDQWFFAAWMLATHKPGLSAHQFQRQSGLTRLETAWTLLHKLRSGLVAPDRDKLTTKCNDSRHTDHWIEVDHIEIGGEQTMEQRKKRGSNKSIVLVAVEVHAWHDDSPESDQEPEPGKPASVRRKSLNARGKSTVADTTGTLRTKAGRCRLRVVPGMWMDVTNDVLVSMIERGSPIVSDAHASFGAPGWAGLRRRETIVAKTHPDPLPTIGRVTTNLKRWLEGTHKGAVMGQHLQAYLNEFVFRFNRRDIPWVAFNRALALAVLGRPGPTYEGLYKHTWVHRNPDPAALARAQGLLG